MADNKENPTEGFKIFDRRKFTITGEERSDRNPEERTPPPEPLKEPPRREPPKTPPPRSEAPRREPGPTPPPRKEPPKPGRVDASDPGASGAGEETSAEFGAFLMSLANTAMMYMEAAGDPLAGRAQQNIAAAKQMIDWLSVLQRKTEGNRTAEESHLLENLLYELRMQFLAKNKSKL